MKINMFEIKITGNTADEIRKDVKELFRTFGIQEQEVTKPEKSKNKKVEKEQAKEADDKSNDDSNAHLDTKEDTGNDTTTAEPVNEDTEGDKSESEPESRSEGDEVTYTLEEVRAKAAALQREGKRDLVKSIITSAGASKLTEVDPSKYGWMMECFEAGCVIKEV